MGRKSREKRERREGKPVEVNDPLRWLRADVAAKDARAKQYSMAYHQVRAAYEESLEKLEKSIEALKAAKHPLYVEQTAPETAPAATESGEVPADAQAPESSV